METQEQELVLTPWMESLVLRIQGSKYKTLVNALTEKTMLEKLTKALDFNLDEFTAAAYLLYATADPLFYPQIRTLGQSSLGEDPNFMEDLLAFDNIHAYAHYHGIKKFCEDSLSGMPLDDASKTTIATTVAQCSCEGTKPVCTSALFAALFTAQGQIARIELKAKISMFEAQLLAQDENIQSVLDHHGLTFGKEKISGNADGDMMDRHPNARKKFLDLD